MSKEGKVVKKRFNLLDAFIVLVIVVLIGGGWYVYEKQTENMQKNKQVIDYTVELKAVTQSFADAIKTGDLIRESIRGNTLGYVEEVTSAPATEITTDYINGKYVNAPIPNKLDLMVKIKSEAMVSEKSISVGGLEIKIGQKLAIKGKGYANQGFILNINIKE